MHPANTSRPAVAVIGAGALGHALARRLALAGYPVAAVLSRRIGPARRLAKAVGASVAEKAVAALPAAVRLVFCCVPDDAIGAVSEALYRVDHAWKSCTVAHTSGALTAAALEPLALRGAATMSFHPLQTFALPGNPAAFDGIYVGLEGDARALVLGRQVAADLGAHAVVISGAAKARYHLAAALASNGLVTLMAMAGEVLASIGLSRQEGAALIQPLVEGTWRNLQRQMPEETLTGPVARGDLNTLRSHLAAIRSHLPHLLPAYAALTTETVRVAVRAGKLDPRKAETILDALHAALDASDDMF